MERFPVRQADRARRYVLIGALIANLALLAYKYANFFLDNLSLIDPQWHFAVEVTLPLGISFFTFTQIVFLVDAYPGKSSEPSSELASQRVVFKSGVAGGAFEQ